MKSLRRFLSLIRYPLSSPEDLGSDLGVQLSNNLSFDQFVSNLTELDYHPHHLHKCMPRAEAEKQFTKAVRKEKFQLETHFCYYFQEGWMEVDLHFDAEKRLRRLYLKHKQIDHEMGIEIPLKS